MLVRILIATILFFMHAQATAKNQKLPTASFEVGHKSGFEDYGHFPIKVILSKPAPKNITLYYKVEGSATYNDDYGLSQGPLKISRGKDQANIMLKIKKDQLTEDENENIKISLVRAKGAKIGARKSFEFIIYADDF